MISFIADEYFTKRANFLVIRFTDDGKPYLDEQCGLQSCGTYLLPKHFHHIAVLGENVDEKFNKKLNSKELCIHVNPSDRSVTFIAIEDLDNFSSL